MGVDAVVVLAAGAGTRMKSAAPKVVHPILGLPLVEHVLRAVRPLEPTVTACVVGHGREAVQAAVLACEPAARVVVQEQQNGTGHAMRIALDAMPDLQTGSVLVLAGDSPLITSETLRALVDAHNTAAASVTVLTSIAPDPHGYGRIVRAGDGRIARIVEQADADEATAAVDEVNSGVYVFDIAALRAHLAGLGTDNAQGEEYLTDVIAAAVSAGQTVIAHTGSHEETMGINDRVQLAHAAAVMRDHINDRVMRAGVTLIDPASTWIGPDASIAADTVIEPGCQILGRTSIAAAAVIGPQTTLLDCEVGEGAHVRRTEATRAVIGAGCDVGPFTYLRPGTVLGKDAKAGAYVEIKESTIGDHSKVPHLSYVGDATVGSDTNIGAATVFVNYDGVAKHRTTVGDGVRIGSDTMLVAPVTVGDGAYTAAGSVITEDVPAGSMAVGRARQRNILDWVLRKRAGSSSAQAAQRAQQEES
ncbi:MAG: bifunctional UDP-N-acetylglucosamine diphosphorylase/glucosamine-1-phosphate N-acetyltransferase GlmU [Actinomycetales bacterium]|nr:bifunctional UDP-N-acetylglucosamine diphosphorylase/glucosamine-1-phosphate N-acetyltransferase GlmU [Actinomycetales bacterium]